MRQLAVAACVGLFGPAALAATAIPTGANFAVSAIVATGCLIVGNPSQVSGISFGTLDFGSQPAVVGTNVNASVSMGVSGMAQIQCTSGVAVTMTVDGGQNASGSQRRLKLSSGGKYISYGLYAAAGGSSPISPSVGVSISNTGSAMTVPVWGIATLPGSGLPPGSYTDTVQVVFSW